MATFIKYLSICLVFNINIINVAFAQLHPMSPVIEKAVTLVEDLEKANNIIMKCEFDYLFSRDSMRKNVRFAFYDGDVYRLDLFGKENNNDTYTIAVYNVDKDGNRTTLVPSPMTEKMRSWVKFRPPTTGAYDIEISGKSRKAADFYVQYGFIIARAKGDDIDDDERVLQLVKIGATTTEKLEKLNMEPVHTEINTIVQGQSVEVLRTFNRNRDYMAVGISTSDITELQINLYEKQKGKWKVVANGAQYEKTSPNSGDYVYATITPDSMAEYATVVAGKQFKKGEMAGRCLILITSNMKPVAADVSSNSPFRPIRGKVYPFKHISTYNDVITNGKIKPVSGSFEFSSSMTTITINNSDFFATKEATFTILSRNYSEKEDAYDFAASDTDNKRYYFVFYGRDKTLVQRMDDNDAAYRIYIADKPKYKEMSGKVIGFNHVENSENKRIRNEKGSLIINSDWLDATFYSETSGKTLNMTMLQFWYYETETYKTLYLLMKDSKGKLYNFSVSNTFIYNRDTKEFYMKD